MICRKTDEEKNRWKETRLKKKRIHDMIFTVKENIYQ